MKQRGTWNLVRGLGIATALALAAAGCDADDTTGGVGGSGGLDTVGGIGDNDGTGGVDDVGGIGGGDTGGSKPGGDAATTDGGSTGGSDSATADVPAPDDAGAEDVWTPGPDTQATDSGGGVDVPDPTDVAVDAGPGPTDTGNPKPDVQSGSCVAGDWCPVPIVGLPDVAIVQKSGSAPTLGGGPKPEGDYELSVAEIYLDSVNGGSPLPIAITVKSNGNTFGSSRFEEEAWSVAANLDLFLSISALGQSFNFEQEIGGGGCFTLSGNTMDSDLLECYGGDPPDVPLPDSFQYSNSGETLRIKVTVDNSAILNAIPTEYQSLAKAFIKDDLDIILELTAVP